MAKKVWVARVELPRPLKDVVRNAAKTRGMTIQGFLAHSIELALKENAKAA